MMNVSISCRKGTMIVYSFVSLKDAFVILRIIYPTKSYLIIGYRSNRIIATLPYRPFLRDTSPAYDGLREDGKMGKPGPTPLSWQALRARGKGQRRWRLT